MTSQIHLQPQQIGQLINNSKSLPPSPISRDNHYYYSKSQHNSPCILSQIQQAREILNSIEQQYYNNNKSTTPDNNNSTINELKDVQNSIIEINNNVINSNVNNIINQDNNNNSCATINRNVSPLIISEGSGNIIKNQSQLQHTIEMDTLVSSLNTTTIETPQDLDGQATIVEEGETEEEAEITEAQRLRDERIQEIRLSIQNETLLKNFTRWNIAYGLLGFLTVISTVCMFIMGFVNTKDNIIYAGIGLSTLGFIIINHSIHIAYRKSRRNIENFQEEFIRIHESTSNTDNNVDPTTIPSKLEKLTIGILSSPILEKPTTPKLDPKNNNINSFNIFSPTPSR